MGNGKGLDGEVEEMWMGEKGHSSRRNKKNLGGKRGRCAFCLLQCRASDTMSWCSRCGSSGSRY
jgi:hypothetical protein